MNDEFKPPFLWLDGLFVKAPLENVLPRFRGGMASVIAGEGIEKYEVTGDAARVDLMLGPDSLGCMTKEQREWSLSTFRVRGFARTSTVRCNPNWTFVEARPLVSPTSFFLEGWVPEPQIAVWSGHVCYPGEEPDENGGFMHGFQYCEGGKTKRYVDHTKNIDENVFTNRGLMQPFENPAHFRNRRREDKMNRAVLYEILGNLDIDPISVFERRELDNTHLYFDDHEGQSCAIYEDDRLRYVRSFD